MVWEEAVAGNIPPIGVVGVESSTGLGVGAKDKGMGRPIDLGPILVPVLLEVLGNPGFSHPASSPATQTAILGFEGDSSHSI